MVALVSQTIGFGGLYSSGQGELYVIKSLFAFFVVSSSVRSDSDGLVFGESEEEKHLKDLNAPRVKDFQILKS